MRVGCGCMREAKLSTDKGRASVHVDHFLRATCDFGRLWSLELRSGDKRHEGIVRVVVRRHG